MTTEMSSYTVLGARTEVKVLAGLLRRVCPTASVVWKRLAFLDLKELDMTEQLSTAQHSTCKKKKKILSWPVGH